MTIVIICGATFQASIGYGFGLVVVPFLLLLNPALVPVPLLVASVFLMAYVSFKNRFSLSGHSVKPLLIGLLFGAPLGALILTFIDSTLFIYSVSVVVLLGLILSGLNISIKVSKISQFASGLLANIIGTSTGLGGVAIALLYQNESGKRIRAVLSTAFLIGSLFSLVALYFTSNITSTSIILGLYLQPGVVLGSLLGARLAVYIDQGYSRIAILLLSILSVLALILKTL